MRMLWSRQFVRALDCANISFLNAIERVVCSECLAKISRLVFNTPTRRSMFARHASKALRRHTQTESWSVSCQNGYWSFALTVDCWLFSLFDTLVVDCVCSDCNCWPCLTPSAARCDPSFCNSNKKCFHFTYIECQTRPKHQYQKKIKPNHLAPKNKCEITATPQQITNQQPTHNQNNQNITKITEKNNQNNRKNNQNNQKNNQNNQKWLFNGTLTGMLCF